MIYRMGGKDINMKTQNKQLIYRQIGIWKEELEICRQRKKILETQISNAYQLTSDNPRLSVRQQMLLTGYVDFGYVKKLVTNVLIPSPRLEEGLKAITVTAKNRRRYVKYADMRLLFDYGKHPRIYNL